MSSCLQDSATGQANKDKIRIGVSPRTREVFVLGRVVDQGFGGGLADGIPLGDGVSLAHEARRSSFTALSLS